MDASEDHAPDAGGHAAPRPRARRPRTIRRYRPAGFVAIAAVAALTIASCGNPVVQGIKTAQQTGTRGQGTGSGTGEAAESAGPLMHPHSRRSRPGNAPPGSRSRSGTPGGVLFGGNVQVANLSGSLGRSLAIVRVYYHIGDKFPWPPDRRRMAHGTTVLVSLGTRPSGPTYASIASGHHDYAIRRFLKEVERAAVRYRLSAIYFTFQQEANNPGHGRLGTPAEFVQAWDHIHQLAVAAHLDWNQGGRVHWVWVLSDLAFEPWATRPKWARAYGNAAAFWPGPSEADIVGVDGYDRANCAVTKRGRVRGAGAMNPGSLFDPVLGFAQQQGSLPVFIAEWGANTYDSPGVQPKFIHLMQNYVIGHSAIAAALYWSGRAKSGHCDYSIVGQPASLSALAAMGRSPVLQGWISRVNR